MRILFAGIIARYPFGGVTWCSLMYLLGLRALGHEVFYIEDTGECVYDPVQNTRATDPSYGTSYIDAALAPFGLGDQWSFVNYDGTYHGRSADEVRRYAADADLFINLSGGSWFWRDEYLRIPHKVFIDSDPAFTQLAIAKAEPWYVDFFQRFDRLFTFGSNIGTDRSPVPTGAFTWHRTWQPITLDDWRTDTSAGDRFTSVMTWQIESSPTSAGTKIRNSSSTSICRREQPSVSNLRSTDRRSCCVNTDGRRWTRCAYRGLPRSTANSSIARRPSSASPSTRTSRRGPDGSAIVPSVTSRLGVRPWCRTRAGPRISHRARGSSPSRPSTKPSPPSIESTAIIPVMPRVRPTSHESTSMRESSFHGCWSARAHEHQAPSARHPARHPAPGTRHSAPVTDRSCRPSRHVDSSTAIGIGGDDDIAVDGRARRAGARRDALRNRRLDNDGKAAGDLPAWLLPRSAHVAVGAV